LEGHKAGGKLFAIIPEDHEPWAVGEAMSQIRYEGEKIAT